MKRSGRFYRRNEADVMRKLGFKPTKNSGSGWIEKEDGQSDNLICQLKSTDAGSIKVSKYDIDTLIHNASVSKKLPVFAIQFLSSNEVYLIVRPCDIEDIAKFIDTGINERKNDVFESIEDGERNEEYSAVIKNKIASSKKARMLFDAENESKYKKGSKSAK